MKKFILSFLFFIPFISYGQNSSQLESFEKIKGSYSSHIQLVNANTLGKK